MYWFDCHRDDRTGKTILILCDAAEHLPATEGDISWQREIRRGKWVMRLWYDSKVTFNLDYNTKDYTPEVAVSRGRTRKTVLLVSVISGGFLWNGPLLCARFDGMAFDGTVCYL
jgi:hypothetical protein